MKENPFTLDLFENKKEIFFFLLFILIVLGIQLYQKHTLFESITASKFYTTDAMIEKQYQKLSKTGKTYHVLKVKSDDGYHFYTTNYEDLKDINGRKVSIGMITNQLSFKDFLQGFYVPSYDIRLKAQEQTLRSTLQALIEEQHESAKMKSLFSALFLAIPISKELRADVSFLGVSHLIAISGFHLGILFTILYFVFYKCYYFFQNRYFPYRNSRFDLTIVVLVLLSGYMALLGYVPSVVRSFVMLLLGFLLYHRSFRIVSFEVLFVAICLILALIPEFIFSIGFWFSVSGVFYIYLFLHHFSHLKNWQIFLVLNFWVYLAMMPVVHYIFSDFSLYQLYSPFLTMFFSLFYPLEMFLHLIGEGSLLDLWIMQLFAIKGEIYSLITPWWFLVVYLLLSLGAIFQRRLFYLLLGASLLLFVFI
ncbi:MAG: ComEC/Rec2 family competence protein [Epsilonproteobacteria bacterium]|nr:ComEC/Rec2 family competence protein [Campylobacterota bacterium]